MTTKFCECAYDTNFSLQPLPDRRSKENPRRSLTMFVALVAGAVGAAGFLTLVASLLIGG